VRSSVNYLSRRSMQDARASCSLAIVKLDSPPGAAPLGSIKVAGSIKRAASGMHRRRSGINTAVRGIHFPRGKKVHPRAARVRISLMKCGFIASVGRWAPEGSTDAFNAIERAIITNNARVRTRRGDADLPARRIVCSFICLFI